MSTYALVIGAPIMLLLLMFVVMALVWLRLMQQEAQADLSACRQERDQLRLLCLQQEAEVAELRSAVRAEKAHVGQLMRRIELMIDNQKQVGSLLSRPLRDRLNKQ